MTTRNLNLGVWPRQQLYRPGAKHVWRQTDKAVDDTNRRIEITVEHQRIVVVKRRNDSSPVSCETCAGRPLMLTSGEAARLLSMPEREIFRRVEVRQAHFAETDGGRLYVCSSSLKD
jgi:hypothetical protein